MGGREGPKAERRVSRFRSHEPCNCVIRLWKAQGEVQNASRALFVDSRYGRRVEGRRPRSAIGLSVPGHQA